MTLTKAAAVKYERRLTVASLPERKSVSQFGRLATHQSEVTPGQRLEPGPAPAAELLRKTTGIWKFTGGQSPVT
jgi:hypothetical protein